MEKGGVLGTLSKHLFWDVDAATMDAETHRGFIIPRVMDRGTRSDVQAIWNQYGAETLKDVLLQAPSLQRKTIFFFSDKAFDVQPVTGMLRDTFSIQSLETAQNTVRGEVGGIKLDIMSHRYGTSPPRHQ